MITYRFFIITSHGVSMFTKPNTGGTLYAMPDPLMKMVMNNPCITAEIYVHKIK